MTEHIVLAPAQLGHLPITNTLLASLLACAILIIVAYKGTRNMALVPSGLQNFLEFAVETLYDLIESILEDPRRTKMFFPWIATFFLFIITINYMGLLPGVGTIGFYVNEQFVPFVRSAASDLNTTLALALISVVIAHYYSIKELGFKGYLAIWFSFNLFLLFSGLLELFLELAKITSLAFRLFGNIFAGETVLDVISNTITPFVVPLPFLALEVIVGFVQALVFAMLTLASLLTLTTSHSDHEHEATQE